MIAGNLKQGYRKNA